MGFIAEAKRKNLWFGTEEKMEWFKTPSRGADTSPAGWDSEGTTLNGGGYVFNSFGSHKQYQFDWGSSNARVVAQKMKSYADGSYGRGYIYFVDPTIYDHNVLPAHWADPSMGIDYEGNAIVAGVEPTGVPTGTNSNDLPVQAAQFNLNTIPVGFRGKAQAVYVPIPEGHTLSLGAMYSFTGSGGVFASPVLLTGAIAAPQKLTTLGVNTPNIVADTFSGVRGVWLWVGKTSADNSTVTIHGLIGRLMTNAEATSYTIAENLFTNPRLVGDGTWAEVARWNTGDPIPVVVQPEDFRVRDLGTGESVMEIERVRGVNVGTGSVAGVSTWQGKPALRLMNINGANPSNYVGFAIPSAARSGGTLIATRNQLDIVEAGVGAYNLLVLSPGQQAPGTNIVGSTPSRLEYTALTSTYSAYLGARLVPGLQSVWWTDIGLFAGSYDGPAFSGSSPQNGTTHYRWTGAIDNSTSEAYYVSAKATQQKRGPWVGGMGHSGCRFVGKPTLIENGPDWTGFSATFKEVVN